MEEQKQKFNWERLLITVAIVLVAGAAVGGTTYYVLDSNFKKERVANEKALTAVQNQVIALEEKTKTPTTQATTPTTTTTPTADWHNYRNTEYGFQLTFTDNWKGYKVLEKKVSFGSFETGSWYFELPTSDPNWQAGTQTEDAGYASLFAVSAFTKAQWNTVQAEEGPKPSKLGETANYIFGYSHAQAGVSEHAAANADITGILNTFKSL